MTKNLILQYVKGDPTYGRITNNTLKLQLIKTLCNFIPYLRLFFMPGIFTFGMRCGWLDLTSLEHTVDGRLLTQLPKKPAMVCSFEAREHFLILIPLI